MPSTRPSSGQLQDFLNLPGPERPTTLPARPGPDRPTTLPARPDVGQPGRPDVGRPGKPDVGRPGKPDIGQPGKPDVGRPGRPDVGQPGRPDVGRPGPGVGRPVKSPVARTARIANYHTRGAAIRHTTAMYHRNFFGPGWWGHYPGRWHFNNRPWRYWWRPAAWVGITGWIAYRWAEPIYYDYGGNVYYEDNRVYVDGQDVGSEVQYAEQVASIANSVPEDVNVDNVEWMPLGVFALVKEDQEDPTMFMQLAVSKDGIIGGTYTNMITNSEESIQGMVNKETQRAAFTVGQNSRTVFETGIYNLTQDETAVLVHFGTEQTQQWLLVRMDQPPESEGDAPAGGTN